MASILRILVILAVFVAVTRAMETNDQHDIFYEDATFAMETVFAGAWDLPLLTERSIIEDIDQSFPLELDDYNTRLLDYAEVPIRFPEGSSPDAYDGLVAFTGAQFSQADGIQEERAASVATGALPSLSLSSISNSRLLRREGIISPPSNPSGQSSGIGVTTAAVALLLPHPLPFGTISAAIYQCKTDATAALTVRNASTIPGSSHAIYLDMALSTLLNVSIVQTRTAPIPLVVSLAGIICTDIDDLVDIGIRRILDKMPAL